MTSADPVLIGDTSARAVHGLSAGADLAVLGGQGNAELAESLRALMVTGANLSATGALPSMLSQLADLAEEGHAVPLVVVVADLSISAAALLDLLDKPGVRTGVLTATPDSVDHGLQTLAPARVGQNGRLVESVGTAIHVVTRPSHVLPGLLRVAGTDRPLAAHIWREAARHLPDQQVDAFSLVVITLVRAGLPVQSAPLGQFGWSRTSAAAAGSAGGPWQQRLRGASRGGDGFFSTYAVRPVSRRLTRTGLALGWSPNAVTVASLCCGVLAAALVATDQRWSWILAALLIQLALVVDCVDGEIARFTRRFSAFGAWLDAVGDRIKEYAVLAALGFVAVGRGNEAWVNGWILAIAAMALVTVRHLEDYAYMHRLAPSRASRPDVIPLAQSRDLGGATDRTTFTGPVSRKSRSIHWAKKVIHMPIAERYLLISLGLLTFQPQLVLWVMVVAVALAMAWTQGGRTALALLGRDRPAAARAPGRTWGHLDHQLDLGPIARLSGRVVRLPFEAALVALTVMCAVVLLGGVVRWPGMLLVCAMVAAVALGGATRPPFHHSLAWQMPALLWLTEVLVVAGVISANLDGASRGVGFAFLAAVAYHRYDVIYRLRDTSEAPAGWVSLLGLGVDGRIILVLGLTLWSPSWTPWLLWIGAIYLAAVYLVESALGWRRWSQVSHRSVDESPLLEVGA